MNSLDIGVDGISLQSSGSINDVEYADADAVVEALTNLFGVEPTIGDGPEGYQILFYDWPGVRVIRRVNAPTSIAASVAQFGGSNIVTSGGVEVGVTREAAEAAGAIDVGEGLGSIGIGARAVPGTVSMTRPGEVGIDFVRLRVESGKVVQIQAPAFDYGDL